MPLKLKPTASQKRSFFIHLIVFAIATVIMVVIHQMQSKDGWAYPWHAWIIAAWGLSLLGHWCSVYTNYEDRGLEEFDQQTRNG